MRAQYACFLSLATSSAVASLLSSTAGIVGLVRRRLPDHADQFHFSLLATNVNNTHGQLQNDTYSVRSGPNDQIHIEGNSASALASGLHWYLESVVHADIYWFIGSQPDNAPVKLPRVNATYSGQSTVQYRYHFNTVTFSYTSAFWKWEEWELHLDWMALRGINLALAWNGYEYILSEVLLEAGFTDANMAGFLSGPAFQAWNRFGNIQGSWGGDLPRDWISEQFQLNKLIVARMSELGITPVLPAFTGFVPTQISQLYPDAAFVNGSNWESFPTDLTNVTFLEPFDPLFSTLQKSFITKQQAAYGNVTHIYTLDQYNENNPYSGELTYLSNVTANTIRSLKAADAEATWLLQGWLFFSSQTFWTNARVEAYLGGVNDSDMLVLDLFSETQPQWQRTNSYYGKPWIWCELHGYGGNMGMYGQIENITVNPVQALANSTMVGVGLTMEGEEGNEIVYDLLLQQAWSKDPIDTKAYFDSWVTTRYHQPTGTVPHSLYTAWDIMRQTVYNNTNLTLAQATTKSIFELSPNITGLLNRTGHHPTTITYDPKVLVSAWNDFYKPAVSGEAFHLWKSSAYRFDLTDITRQVLANAFYPLYQDFIHLVNSTQSSVTSRAEAAKTGQQMLALLADLDAVLAASYEDHFSLSAWIDSARSWAPPASPPSASTASSATLTKSSSARQGASSWAHEPHWDTRPTSSPCAESPPYRHGPYRRTSTAADVADFYEYNARNQVTLWGPTGQISDYASKQWAGLISTYYIPRWQLFIDFTLNGTTSAGGVNHALSDSLLAFEEAWQYERLPTTSSGQQADEERTHDLQKTIARVVAAWPQVFQR